MPEQTDFHSTDPQQEKAERIATLIAGYIRQSLSPTDHDELDVWVGESDKNMLLFEELTEDKKVQEYVDWMNESVNRQQVLKKIKSRIHFNRSNRPFFGRFWQYAIAASLLLVIGSAAYILTRNKKTEAEQTVVASATPIDLQPGTNKAILTLGDGNTLALDPGTNATLATQGNSDVISKDGQLHYNIQNGKNENADLIYNTVTTPRGGSYALTLSDGSRLWLNAASSVKFPASFTGKERKVIVTGEVYFEVAPQSTKGEKMPFKVEVKDKDMVVEVLGTHFNINSYSDESMISTTLAEGKVKVTAGQQTKFLVPAQQAQVNNAGEIKTISDVDLYAITAWKDGVFRFKNTDLKTIMKLVSRWYDVDVEFATSKNPNYNSVLSRNIPVSQILTVLEENGGIHFSISSGKIKVLP